MAEGLEVLAKADALREAGVARDEERRGRYLYESRGCADCHGADARGKVVFMILTANGPGTTADYLNGHPSLRGRMAFLRAQPVKGLKPR